MLPYSTCIATTTATRNFRSSNKQFRVNCDNENTFVTSLIFSDQSNFFLLTNEMTQKLLSSPK